MPEQLASALRYYNASRRHAGQVLSLTRSLRFSSLAELLAVMDVAQAQAVKAGADSVDAMLAEQGIDIDPAGKVNPAAFAGAASDGRDMRGLMSFAQNPTLVTPLQFDRIVLTQVRDAGRNGASTAITSRPKTVGYVRMIQGATCDRCAIMAGSYYRYNSGFERHPFCDCIHVPASENTSGDLRTDPSKYFDSLSSAEQDKAFTKSGAQAIRDGADMSQVVNARRGMQSAQAYGRDLKITTEGITKRGLAGSKLGATKVRLMPESIYKIAENRADAIRLLWLHGYIH